MIYTLDEKTLQVGVFSKTELPPEDDAPMCISVHPKDKLIASGINGPESTSRSLRLFKFTTTGLDPFNSYTHGKVSQDEYIKTIRFSSDGNRLFSAGTDGRLICWKYEGSNLVMDNTPVTHEKNEIVDADFSSDGSMVASISSNQLLVTSSNSEKLIFSLSEVKYKKTTPCTYKSVRFSRSNDETQYLYAIVNTVDRKKSMLVRFTVGQWNTRKSVVLCQRAVTTAEISACGRFIAYATSNFGIGIVDARSLRTITFLPKAHTFAITSLAFHTTQPILLSGSADGHFGLWKIPSPRGVSLVTVMMVMTLLVVMIAYLVLNYVDQKQLELVFNRDLKPILAQFGEKGRRIVTGLTGRDEL